MTPDEIFSRADARLESGMSVEDQRVNMGLDVLRTIESHPNIPASDVVLGIMFNMFERYK